MPVDSEYDTDLEEDELASASGAVGSSAPAAGAGGAGGAAPPGGSAAAASSASAASSSLAAAGGRCIWLARPRLAERLWPATLRRVASAPNKAFVLWAAGNGAFVGTGLLVRGLVAALSLPGFIALVALGLYLGLYNVARAIAYPGFLSSVQRSIERGVAVEVRDRTRSALASFALLLDALARVGSGVVAGHVYGTPAALRAGLVNCAQGVGRARDRRLAPLLASLRRVSSAELDSSAGAGTAVRGWREDLARALERLLAADAAVQALVVAPAVRALSAPGGGGLAAAAQGARPALDALPVDAGSLVLPERVLTSHEDVATRAAVALYGDAQSLLVTELGDAEFAAALALPPRALALLVQYLQRAMALSELLCEQQDPGAALRAGPPAEPADEGDVELAGINSPGLARELEVAEAPEDADEPAPASSSGGGGGGGGGVGMVGHKPEQASDLLWTVREMLNNYQAARAPMLGVASIDLARAELELRFGARQFWVPAADGTRIDAVLVPAAGGAAAEGAAPAPAPSPAPLIALGALGAAARTVLLCNPNCGLYEFAQYQSQWLEFYRRHGFNVIMYNYRGYGRSEGRPAPENLRSDGEALVRFLHAEAGVRKGWLGVHAESMGGVVASHLARHAEALGVSYVVCDRTFSCLSLAAEGIAGGWAGAAVRKLGLAADNVDGLLLAPAGLARLVTCDPNDHIIKDAASLKVGLARALAAAALQPGAGDGDKRVTGVEPRVEQLAITMLGGAPACERARRWALDVAFYDRLGRGVARVVEASRARRSLKLAPAALAQRLRLLDTLDRCIHVLWFADGRCGMALGAALREFLDLWELRPPPPPRDARTQTQTPRPAADIEEGRPAGEDALLAAAKLELPPAELQMAHERAQPLLNFAHCMLVFGRTSPPATRLLQGLSHTDAARRAVDFNLFGERGRSGPTHPVPLAVVHRVWAQLRTQMADALAEAALGGAVAAIAESLQALAASDSGLGQRQGQEQEQVASANPEGGGFVALLPLGCGHNGHMSEPELAVVRQHLVSAGWLAPGRAS
jgi:hypothetical protein